MIVKSTVLKILFGVLALSLVIPFSPSVSSAKAKMCCKKKCLSMMSTVSPSTSKPVKHCSHQKDPVQCCENNCSKVITYKKPEPFTYIGARTEIGDTRERVNFSIFLPELSTQYLKFLSRYRESPLTFSLLNPPLYLSHSILII
jgi:hypothetical protein